MNGVQLIAAERTRQIEDEGYTSEHDDSHNRGELAAAGACYANQTITRGKGVPVDWPYDDEWWKPKGRIRNLVRAGAFIAAEIDRLQRLKAKSQNKQAEP